jgi:hypothetical protein
MNMDKILSEKLRGHAVTKLGLAILIMGHTVTADVDARCLRSNRAVLGVKGHTCSSLMFSDICHRVGTFAV